MERVYSEQELRAFTVIELRAIAAPYRVRAQRKEDWVRRILQAQVDRPDLREDPPQPEVGPVRMQNEDEGLRPEVQLQGPRGAEALPNPHQGVAENEGRVVQPRLQQGVERGHDDENPARVPARQIQEVHVGQLLQEIRTLIHGEMDQRDDRLRGMATQMEDRAQETKRSVQELHAEREAERKWPDRTLNEQRNQHEYDSLVKAGRAVERLLVSSDLESSKRVAEELRQAVMLRTMQVTTGDAEDWRVADHIGASKAVFEEQFADELDRARKRAEKGRKFSETGPRKRMRAFTPVVEQAQNIQSPRPQFFPGSRRNVWPTGPPKGGCFVCGGDHFAKDCPNRQKPQRSS